LSDKELQFLSQAVKNEKDKVKILYLKGNHLQDTSVPILADLLMASAVESLIWKITA